MAEATPEEQLQRVRQRDLFQTYFFKVAARTFGPPKSRERVIIAPPMPTADRDLQLTSDPAPPGPGVGQSRPRRAPVAPLTGADPAPQEPESGPPGPRAGQRDEAMRELQGWMAQRKEFRRQLDSLGDVQKWVRSKPVVSELEASVAERGEAQPRSEQGDARNPPVKPGVGPPRPKKPPRKHAAPPPAIRRPSPQAVSALQRYLHAHRLRLTELFLRLDRCRTGRVSRGDFRTVFEQERIPVDEAQLDDLLVALSSGDADTVSYRELVGGRRGWSLQTREARKSRPAQGRADTEPRPSGGQELGSGLEPDQQRAPSASVSRGSPFLQVPLPCLRERRPLTLEDEEELGRLHRQRRRTAKLGSSDVEALARVWVVKTGRAAVDGHALPSTAGGQSGEAVDRYRRACLRELMDTLQLCQERGLALSEATLERALLHPGDRLLRASDPLLKLRQPGTSPAARTLGQKSAWGDRREKEEEEKAFSAGTSQPRVGTDSRPVYPPRKTVERGKKLVKLSTGRARIGRRTDCWLTFEEYASITRDSPQRPSWRANPDAFWPGRDLETVRLLLPETGRVPEEVLFRPVRRGPAPRPSSWPACAQGLFISGDSEAHKSPLLP